MSSLPANPKDLKPGDKIFIWWDSGAFGMEVWRGVVVRVNRKTVTLLMDHREKPARCDIDRVAIYRWDESLGE